MLAERMHEQRIPGLSYAITIDGELVAASGFGVREVASQAPVEADTVFRIASMTKSFTALAILKLRDAGKLDLDDPASRHVPEMRGWRVPTADSGPVTIRHLLAHAAGFPEDDPQGNYTLDTTPAELSALLSNGATFSTATGTAYEYSNFGFMILGQIVTNVAERPFQEYITEEILRPLGMHSTYWDPDAVHAEKRARGYARKEDAWVEEPQHADGAGAAMGGLLSSAPDLVRFVAMMLAAYPPRDDPGQPPAARRTLRQMQAGLGFPSVSLVSGVKGAAPVARAESYGFGLYSLGDCG